MQGGKRRAVLSRLQYAASPLDGTKCGKLLSAQISAAGLKFQRFKESLIHHFINDEADSLNVKHSEGGAGSGGFQT